MRAVWKPPRAPELPASVPRWGPDATAARRRARNAADPRPAPVRKLTLPLDLPRTVPCWRRGPLAPRANPQPFVLPQSRVGRGIVGSLRLL